MQQTKLVIAPDMQSQEQQYFEELLKDYRKDHGGINEDAVFDLSTICKYEPHTCLTEQRDIWKYVEQAGFDSQEDLHFVNSSRCTKSYRLQWQIRTSDGRQLNSMTGAEKHTVEFKNGQGKKNMSHGILISVASMKRAEKAWFVIPSKYLLSGQAAVDVKNGNQQNLEIYYFWIQVLDIIYQEDREILDQSDYKSIIERCDHKLNEGRQFFKTVNEQPDIKIAYRKSLDYFQKAYNIVQYDGLPKKLKAQFSERQKGEVLWREVRALNNKALCHKKLEEYTNARDAYEQVLRLHPLNKSEEINSTPPTTPSLESPSTTESVSPDSCLKPSTETFEQGFTSEQQIDTFVKASYNLAKLNIDVWPQHSQSIALPLLERCVKICPQDLQCREELQRLQRKSLPNVIQKEKLLYKKVLQGMEEEERREKILKRQREREQELQSKEKSENLKNIAQELINGECVKSNREIEALVDRYIRK